VIADRFIVGADDIPGTSGTPLQARRVFRTSDPGGHRVAWTETGGDVLYIEASLLPGGRATSSSRDSSAT